MDASTEISRLPWFTSDGEAKLFKELGVSCVYAVGPKAGHPLKVGWATQLADRLAPGAAWNWKPLYVHGLVWVQGSLGRRLEEESHRILDTANSRLCGDWFNVQASMICHVFSVAAANLGLKVATHAQMLAEVKRMHEQKIDRQVEMAGALSFVD